MSAEQNVKEPIQHLNLYSRRNGFGAEYDIHYDKNTCSFECKLTVGAGDWTFYAYGQSKKEAKKKAAIAFLTHMAAKKNRVDWGLPKEKAACEAFLASMSVMATRKRHPVGAADSEPKMAHLMILKRLCHRKRLNLRIEVKQGESGHVVATALLFDGRSFVGEGPSKRKAMAAAAHTCLTMLKSGMQH
uniref:DRBM domain-containing protein n=1 Tax=Trichuris muris TaxID=70415 RepID=A0A5S6QJJ1_TRIMR